MCPPHFFLSGHDTVLLYGHLSYTGFDPFLCHYFSHNYIAFSVCVVANSVINNNNTNNNNIHKENKKKNSNKTTQIQLPFYNSPQENETAPSHTRHIITGALI